MTQKIKFCMQKISFPKMFVCVKNSISGWKKLQNYLEKFNLENFRVAINKKPVIQFPYMEIVWQAFSLYTWCMELYEYDKHFHLFY